MTIDRRDVKSLGIPQHQAGFRPVDRKDFSLGGASTGSRTAGTVKEMILIRLLTGFVLNVEVSFALTAGRACADGKNRIFDIDRTLD